jgi:hypothetical protein
MKYLALAALIAASPALASPPSASLQASIRADLESKMRDARSARFIWPDVASPRVYCGFINGRNAMGAYVGYRLFYAITDGGRIDVQIQGTGIVGDLAPRICADAGYPISPSAI